MSEIKESHVEQVKEMFGEKTGDRLDDALINLIFGKKEKGK